MPPIGARLPGANAPPERSKPPACAPGALRRKFRATTFHHYVFYCLSPVFSPGSNSNAADRGQAALFELQRGADVRHWRERFAPKILNQINVACGVRYAAKYLIQINTASAPPLDRRHHQIFRSPGAGGKARQCLVFRRSGRRSVGGRGEMTQIDNAVLHYLWPLEIEHARTGALPGKEFVTEAEGYAALWVILQRSGGGRKPDGACWSYTAVKSARTPARLRLVDWRD
jgi:hypothetical protein